MMLVMGLCQRLPASARRDAEGIAAVVDATRHVHNLLAKLDDARLITDKTKKRSVMNQTVKELTETKHTLTSESLQTLTTANSSIVAESTRTLHEWGESAISGRTSVLGALMTARVRAAKLLLMTTTSELANIAGGAPEGKSWKADVADNDWTALLERGQVLFVAFQQASVKKAGDKLDKARRTYIKEAHEAGVAVDEVKADVAAAEK